MLAHMNNLTAAQAEVTRLETLATQAALDRRNALTPEHDRPSPG
jgi:hypothetical protein